MTRPKIILATVGSLGDLHPFLAIGQALLARGSHPVLAVPLDHVAKCHEAGLEAEAILPSFDELGRATGLDDDEIVRRVMADTNFLVSEILLRSLSDSTARLIALAAGADAVVGSIFAFAAPIAAEALAVPYIAAVLQPMSWFSLLDPPSAPGFGALAKRPLGTVGRNWNRLIGAMMAAELKRRYARRIDAVRLSHGLPKSAATPVLQPGTPPMLSLGLYSPTLAELPLDAPLPAALTGFPWFDSADGGASVLSPELASFLADGPAPLIVTLGSFVPFAAREFYRRAAEIALEMKMRAVLLTQVDPGIADPSIKVVDYAPHSLLFPHAAAIVHHGGVGTTGQALRSGKPQLIVPFMGDQFDHAKRLGKLGVGVSATPREFMAAGAGLLRELLDNPMQRENADRIARTVRLEKGAGDAADKILHAVGG
ncbi:glycosyltransferase [soil metagenome]